MTKISLIYVNIKHDKKTLHTFCFEGALRTKMNARGCIVQVELYYTKKNYLKLYIPFQTFFFGRIIQKKKNYLKYNIGMKSRVEIVTNNP